MKKYLLITLFALLWLEYGCDSEYETYNGEDVIYMNETTDTTRFSFTYVDSKYDRQTQEINIKAVGKVYDYDRVVNIKFTPKNAVEGVDFEPLAEQYVVNDSCYPDCYDTDERPPNRRKNHRHGTSGQRVFQDLLRFWLQRPNHVGTDRQIETNFNFLRVYDTTATTMESLCTRHVHSQKVQTNM